MGNTLGEPTLTWAEFLFRALELLRRPPDCSRFGLRSLIQIVVQCYEFRPASWTVLLPEDGSVKSTVFVRTWCNDVDYPDVDKLEDAGYNTEQGIPLRFQPDASSKPNDR